MVVVTVEVESCCTVNVLEKSFKLKANEKLSSILGLSKAEWRLQVPSPVEAVAAVFLAQPRVETAASSSSNLKRRRRSRRRNDTTKLAAVASWPRPQP